MARLITSFLFTVLAVAAPLSLASAQDAPPQGIQARHCPENAAGTFRFFEKSGQTEQDKSRLETLAGIAKQQPSLCILALTDPTQLQSRRLAVRRVKWVLDILTNNGVPRNLISVELRPSQGDADAMRQVQVIFGR